MLFMLRFVFKVNLLGLKEPLHFVSLKIATVW